MAVKVTPTITHYADLEYRVGSSDKVYHIWIENVGANHTVKFRYGRRGSTLTEGIKIGPTHSAEAFRQYNTVLREKIAKGYKYMPGKTTGAPSRRSPLAAKVILGAPVKTPTSLATTRKGRDISSPSVQLLNPIDEEALNKLILDDDWFMQEKHDGKRMLLVHFPSKKSDIVVMAYNRKGQEIEPPEEYCIALQKFGDHIFILDGEACGPVFYAFDILQLDSIECEKLRLDERLINLGMLMRSAGAQNTIRMVSTAETTMQKKSMIRAIREAGREGAVLKDRTVPYTAGRPNSGGPALKFKLVETVSCQVTKINDKRSVMLMLDKGVHVGSVTIPANHEIPKVKDIVDVQYLYAYKEGSLYQPVYKGKRDDIDKPESVKKLKYKPEEK